MRKALYFITLLALAMNFVNADAYNSHKGHKGHKSHTYSKSYQHKKKSYSYKPINSEARKEDSLLNVPNEKPVINYSEKDVPIEFVIKLDSAMHLYQTENTARVSKCDNDSMQGVELSDSMYIARLQKIPSIMELTYNDIIRSYITLYTVRKRKLSSYIVGQSDYYFPMFTDALDAEGLPLELRNLAVIESGLNPRAYSPAGASGLWQFISSTGAMYGLKINSLVDERRDPYKATRAAAKYLKHLYGIYNDWTLVIAAYNCGPGNVNKAIRRAGGSKDYWEIYEFLPKETRCYVPAFIAANYLMNYYKEENICPKEFTRPIAVDTIMVNDNVHLQQIATVLNIDMTELEMLNPQYRKDIIPGNSEKAYTLALPANKINQYEMYKNTILAYEVPTYRKSRPQVTPKTYYTAQKRQKKVVTVDSTLLAKTDSVATNTVQADSISQESKQNTLLANNTKAKTSAKAAKKKPAKKKVDNNLMANTKYKVKKGDSLYSIAARHNVSVMKLKQWNSLNTDNINIGQTIVVKPK